MSTKNSVGRPKAAPTAKKLLKELMPVNDLFDDIELVLYNSLVDVFLKDFDEEDLTAGDLDDIMTLAMNKIFEIRLLKTCKDKHTNHLDINKMIETSRKQTDKIKESLASRRKDRVDPNELKGFSIVDLAVAYDSVKRDSLNEKSTKLKTEESVARQMLEDHPGNKFDGDLLGKSDA